MHRLTVCLHTVKSACLGLYISSSPSQIWDLLEYLVTFDSFFLIKITAANRCKDSTYVLKCIYSNITSMVGPRCIHRCLEKAQNIQLSWKLTEFKCIASYHHIQCLFKMDCGCLVNKIQGA